MTSTDETPGSEVGGEEASAPTSASRPGLAEAVERLVAEADSAARLTAADTTVRIVVSDDSSAGAVLLFDRDPPEVLEQDADESVEAELTLERQVLDDVLSRECRLAMALIDGRATYSGPIRKFLRILPIVIAAAREDEEDGDDPVDEFSEKEGDAE